MNTFVNRSAGLVLGAALALTAMGCKTSHYHVTTTVQSASDDGARCAAMCEHLVEERAIPRSSAKECQSACLSSASAASPAASATTALPAASTTAPRPCEEARPHRRRRSGAPAVPAALPACDDGVDCTENAPEAGSFD